METNTAKPIGETLPAVMASATPETGSSAISTTRFSELDLAVLDSLPKRLSDTLLTKVEAIANCPLPAVEPCDEDQFDMAMRSLSILPRKGDDEATGKLRRNLYYRKLQGFSNEAVGYLCSKALETCKFFPTISECLGILKGHDSRHMAIEAQEKAKVAVRNELQHRMEDTMTALCRGDLDGEQIAALPERIRSIAEARGLLWNDGDGKYRPRPDDVLADIREGAQKRMGF